MKSTSRGVMRTARDAAGAAAIVRAIERTGGDVAGAAVLLGIQRSWLYVLIGRSPPLQNALKKVRDLQRGQAAEQREKRR